MQVGKQHADVATAGAGLCQIELREPFLARMPVRSLPARPNAARSSTCHSHHERCQLRAKAIAIIDSAKSMNADGTANSISEGWRRHSWM